MSNVIKVTLATALISCAFACSSGNRKSGDNYRDLPRAGVVHEQVVATTRPGLSYALYLPSAMAGDLPGKRYPVILALDPQASGLSPVRKYSSLAEKYGFIMAGSNDSRNGQPADDIDRIVGGMIDELKAVYPTDSTRIYIIGFSGGARVACIVGMFYPEVRGVIGCGAGFPSVNRQPLYTFDYFGIAGTADLNMNEMLQLDLDLSKTGYRHFVITHPGRHQWPPLPVVEEGFRWTVLNDMRDGRIARDTALAGRMYRETMEMAVHARKENRMIEAEEKYREAVDFADKLLPGSAAESDLAAVRQDPAYKSQAAYREKILATEAGLQQALGNAVLSEDLAWWQNRIKKLYPGRNTKLTPEDTLMYARVRGYLSLLCYSDARASLHQGNDEKSAKIITIYEWVDPGNPEPNVMRAMMMASGHRETEAMEQLKIAAGKGFDDRDRLENQPEFTGLKNLPAWSELIKTLK